MLKSTLETQIYYFACHLLECVMSFLMHVDIEIATEKMDTTNLTQDGAFEKLIDWASTEGFSLIGNNTFSQDQETELMSFTEDICDALTFRWGKVIQAVTTKMHQKQAVISETMWIYYYYCRSLWQVLREFDQVLQEVDGSSVYHQRYLESSELFQRLAAVVERERPFWDTPEEFDEDTVHSIWAEIDNFAIKLGNEWRQAVLEAAHNQKLPDFMNENDM